MLRVTSTAAKTLQGLNSTRVDKKKTQTICSSPLMQKKLSFMYNTHKFKNCPTCEWSVKIRSLYVCRRLLMPGLSVLDEEVFEFPICKLAYSVVA